MAKHKYDGNWKYFENPKGGDDKFAQGKPMKLTIPREDGKVDRGSSNHDNKEVSGVARDDGITLFRHETGNRRTFHGTTMFEVPLKSGDVFAVIKGTYIDDEEKKKDGEVETTQIQGDWIITKP
jgi:hypothetical protein